VPRGALGRSFLRLLVFFPRSRRERQRGRHRPRRLHEAVKIAALHSRLAFLVVKHVSIAVLRGTAASRSGGTYGEGWRSVVAIV
jgi:hypothetical protein